MTFPPKFPCLDAPKYVNVTAAAEQQEPDGRSSVMLTCSSHSYPPVKKYSWYRKMSAEDEKGEKVSDWSSYKLQVPSDKPGYYYCIAENDIDKKSSDQVQLFVYRGWIQDHLSVFEMCTISLSCRRDVEDTKYIFAVFTLMFCLFSPQEACGGPWSSSSFLWLSCLLFHFLSFSIGKV